MATFDPPLPSADRYYLSRPSALPTGGEDPGAWAGSPGWAFARVLADADGNRMVPHHRAVDVVSDNRLLATASWTSSHEFRTPCASPEVEAVLLYRPWPRSLAVQRHWSMPERVVQRTIR